MNHDLGPGQAADKRADDFGALVMGVDGQDDGARLQAGSRLGAGLGLQRVKAASPSGPAVHSDLAVAGHMGEKGQVDAVAGQRGAETVGPRRFSSYGEEDPTQAPASRTLRPPT